MYRVDQSRSTWSKSMLMFFQSHMPRRHWLEHGVHSQCSADFGPVRVGRGLNILYASIPVNFIGGFIEMAT